MPEDSAARAKVDMLAEQFTTCKQEDLGAHRDLWDGIDRVTKRLERLSEKLESALLDQAASKVKLGLIIGGISAIMGGVLSAGLTALAGYLMGKH